MDTLDTNFRAYRSYLKHVKSAALAYHRGDECVGTEALQYASHCAKVVNETRVKLGEEPIPVVDGLFEGHDPKDFLTTMMFLSDELDRVNGYIQAFRHQQPH